MGSPVGFHGMFPQEKVYTTGPHEISHGIPWDTPWDIPWDIPGDPMRLSMGKPSIVKHLGQTWGEGADASIENTRTQIDEAKPTRYCTEYEYITSVVLLLATGCFVSHIRA